MTRPSSLPGISYSSSKKPARKPFTALAWRVSDGTRTRDRLDHNQELYHLSYAHQATVGM
jgi:hypothetical protein